MKETYTDAWNCNYTMETIHPFNTLNMFIIFHQENTNAEINKEILILKEDRPTTIYVAATFHPTIGQCAHQSVSIIATPELGIILTRNKGTLPDSHIAKDTTKTQPSQQSWVYQAAEELEKMTPKIVSTTTEL